MLSQVSDVKSIELLANKAIRVKLLRFYIILTIPTLLLPGCLQRRHQLLMYQMQLLFLLLNPDPRLVQIP